MEHEARNTKQRIIIAITGASGTQYAIQLMKLLKTKPIEIHLIISEAAKLTANYEVSMPIKEIETLADVVYSNKSIWADIASGSFKTMGMIIIPCSIKSMSQISYSIGGSLISRAADVCLKEQRKVILVVREAPHHAGHLESMLKLANMGATIFPPVPALYAMPKSIEEMIDHTVGRILDVFGIDNDWMPAWDQSQITNKPANR